MSIPHLDAADRSLRRTPMTPPSAAERFENYEPVRIIDGHSEPTDQGRSLDPDQVLYGYADEGRAAPRWKRSDAPAHIAYYRHSCHAECGRHQVGAETFWRG